MEQRALLTQREREVIQGIDVDNIENVTAYRQKIRSRVRQRIENLEDDLNLLGEHEPGLSDELRSIVCTTTQADKLDEILEEIHSLHNKIENSE